MARLVSMTARTRAANLHRALIGMALVLLIGLALSACGTEAAAERTVADNQERPIDAAVDRGGGEVDVQ